MIIAFIFVQVIFWLFVAFLIAHRNELMPKKKLGAALLLLALLVLSSLPFINRNDLFKLLIWCAIILNILGGILWR